MVVALICSVVLIAVTASAASAAAGWYHDRTYGETPRPLGDNNHVNGLAADPWGNVYVADDYNHRVQKFDSSRTSVLAFGTAMLGQGGLRNPQGVGVSPVDGSVYVTDSVNGKIEKFAASGESVLSFGSPGSGDGQLNGPAAITVKADGEVWVSDTNNHRVQRFGSDGTYLGQFGGSGAANGQFTRPRGGCFAADGTFYVADEGNHRVQRFSAVGTFMNAYGSFGSTDGTFDQPYQVGCDPTGAQFAVADRNNHRIQRFDGSFAFLGSFGSQGAAAGQFRGASGVAIDSSGRIWASDFDGSRVQVFSNTGSYVGEAGSDNLSPNHYKNVFGVAPNADGSRVYVSDTNNDRIQYYDGNGNWLGAWGSSGTGDGQFDLPYGIVVEPAGDVLVVDRQNKRVQRFTANGAYVSKFGSAGTGDGQFSNPWDIARSPVDGSIYVADTGSNRVQRFSSAGAYMGQVGATGSGNGQFSSPHGVAVDSTGAVYVADSGNNRIQKFTAALGYTSQWGSLGTGAGQFDAPSGLAALPDDTIVVVENDNPRIQHFTNTGGFLRMAGTSGIGTGQLGWPRNAKAGVDGSLYIADASNSRAVRWRLATAGPPNTLFVHDTSAQAASCGGLFCVNPVFIDEPQPHYSWINQYGASISGQRTQVRTTTLDGVVGLWHLDGTLADSSPFGHALSPWLASSTWTRGARDFGAALALGPGDATWSPPDARYELSIFTIEGWYRHSGPFEDYGLLVERGGSPTDRNYALVLDGPNQLIGFSYSSAGIDRYGATTPAAMELSDGLWHHVAATSDGTTSRLYVDGALRGTAPMVGTPDNPATGPSMWNETGVLHVDEIRISNVVRTAEEIAGYYRTRQPHATLLWDSSPTDTPVALAACADGARCADVVHGTGGSQPLGPLRGGRYAVQAKFHSGAAWSDWSGGDWYEHATGRPSLGYVDNTDAQTGAGNNTGILALDPRFSWTNNMGRSVAADRRRIQVVTTPLDDVEALWRFDTASGVTSDSAGNGNVLTPVNAPAESAGQAGFGESRSFSGTNQYYTASATVANSSTMTFEAWFRSSSVGSCGPDDELSLLGEPIQVRIDCAGGLLHGRVTTSGGTLLHYVYDSTYANVVDGRWHHVAVTVDDTARTLRIYRDGIPGEQLTLPESITLRSATSFLVGDSAGGLPFNGELDEVRISTVARTAAEIKGYYETRRPHYDTMWDSDPAATGTVTMASCGDLSRCTDATYAGATMRYADARYYARARHKESAKSYWSAWSDWDWYQAQTPPAPTAIRTHDTSANPGSVNPTDIASPAPRFSFVSNAYQSSAAQRLQVLTTSLDDVVAHWDLDGDGVDSVVGRTMALDAGASAPTWQAAPTGFGQALRFDGDDGASAQHAASMDLDELTVEAWYATSLPGPQSSPTLVAKETGAADRNLSLFFRSSGDLCIGISLGGVQQDDCVPTPPAVRNGSWHHAAATRDGAGLVSLYLDGVLQGSWSRPGDVDNPSVPVTIGVANGDYAATGFTGDIDDVRISRVARTAAEILGAYRTGRPHNTVMWDSSPSDAGAAMANCASGARCADVTYGTGGGELPIIRPGARYHVRAKVLTQSGSWSAWSLADWFETQQTMTVSVDQPTRAIGSVLPGADATGTTVVTVTTNSSTGYQLLATDLHDARFASRDGATHLPDWTGTDATPTAWAAGTPGFGGITVLGATGAAPSRLAKWGPGTNRTATDFANNLYAGLRQSTSTVLHTRATQSLPADTVTAAYRVNAALAQPAGAYSGTVTYTAIANP